MENEIGKGKGFRFDFMNKQFLTQSLKAIAPIVLIFSLMWVKNATVGDFWFHYRYTGVGSYPIINAVILNFISFFMERGLALFLVNITFTIVLPYILIHEITKNQNKAWLYLYASQIPYILGFVWLLPQAIAHCLILYLYLSYINFKRNPPLTTKARLSLILPILVFVIGMSTHHYFIFLAIVLLGFIIVKEKKLFGFEEVEVV